jgi:hypothetical protein
MTVSLGLDPFWPRAPVFAIQIFFSCFASPRFRFLVSSFILPLSFVRCFVHPHSRTSVGQLPPGFVAVSCGADFVLSFFELPVGRASITRPDLFPTQHFRGHPIAACELVSRRVTLSLLFSSACRTPGLLSCSCSQPCLVFGFSSACFIPQPATIFSSVHPTGPRSRVPSRASAPMRLSVSAL